MGMIAGIGSALGSGLSLFGGLEGMFGGGGANSINVPQYPQMDTGGIQSGLNQGIPSLGGYNLGGTNLGQYQNILQNTLNNPFAGGAIGGAQQFGGQAAGNAFNIGQTIPGFLGGAGAIMNTGFDPQNALYNRTANQVQQQSLAGLEGAGIAQTPWGQGVLGNTMSNFNIDWQNQQLGRQSQALQGAEGAVGAAGGAASGAFGLGMQGAGAPYNVFNTIGGQNLGLLQGGAGYGTSAAQIPQQQVGDWLSYLSQATSANQLPLESARLQLGQQQQGFNQNQIYGREIGSGLAGLTGGPGGLGWGNQNPSQMFGLNDPNDPYRVG